MDFLKKPEPQTKIITVKETWQRTNPENANPVLFLRTVRWLGWFPCRISELQKTFGDPFILSRRQALFCFRNKDGCSINISYNPHGNIENECRCMIYGSVDIAGDSELYSFVNFLKGKNLILG